MILLTPEERGEAGDAILHGTPLAKPYVGRYSVGDRNGQIVQPFASGNQPLVNVLAKPGFIIGAFHDEKMAQLVVDLLNESEDPDRGAP